MRFFESEFQAGFRDVVEVDFFGGVAKVMLLDPSGYNDFRAGRDYDFHVVCTRRTRVPHAGHWHLIILPSRLGSVSGTCKLIHYG